MVELDAYVCNIQMLLDQSARVRGAALLWGATQKEPDSTAGQQTKWKHKYLEAKSFLGAIIYVKCDINKNILSSHIVSPVLPQVKSIKTKQEIQTQTKLLPK